MPTPLELADQELLIASHLVPSVSNNHPPQPEERAIASAVPHERRSGSVFPPSVELDAETYLRSREINLSDQSAVLDNVPVQSRLAPRCESQLPQAFHSTSPFSVIVEGWRNPSEICLSLPKRRVKRGSKPPIIENRRKIDHCSREMSKPKGPTSGRIRLNQVPGPRHLHADQLRRLS